MNTIKKISNTWQLFYPCCIFFLVFLSYNVGISQEVQPQIKALSDYFECEECTDGELEAVAKYQDEVVGILSQTMRKGPSKVKVYEKREALGKAYKEMVAYGAKHPESRPTISQDAYVTLYLNNYVTQYQKRAIEALGKIRTTKALDELNKYDQSNAAKGGVKKSLKRVLNK